MDIGGRSVAYSDVWNLTSSGSSFVGKVRRSTTFGFKKSIREARRRAELVQRIP
jgi:hypothetical protein